METDMKGPIDLNEEGDAVLFLAFGMDEEGAGRYCKVGNIFLPSEHHKKRQHDCLTLGLIWLLLSHCDRIKQETEPPLYASVQLVSLFAHTP